MKNKRLFTILSMVGFLLLIPFVAMQFTDEVNWTISDFVVMGILLTVVSLTCEIVMRKVQSKGSRIVICAAILLVFFLVWAELAVGIFGTPFAGT